MPIDEEGARGLIPEVTFTKGKHMEINAAEIYTNLSRRFSRVSPDDLDDAIAESHAVAWQARESGVVLHNVDAFCTVVAKRSLSRVMQRQRRSLYPDHDPLVAWEELEGGSAIAVEEDQDARIDANDVLEEAPDLYAEVLRLHYLEGHTLEDAARTLGVSGACIRKRHERALKWARKHFAR